MFDYSKALEIQKTNSQKNPNLTYLSWLYSQINENLESTRNLLEIGAGAGLSENFLGKIEILRTDLLSWENNSVLGNIDGGNLPFQNNEFSGVFAIDVLHHTNSPYRVIDECLRVLGNNKKFVIIEPYVSYFSYAIYKIFHHEETSWNVDLGAIRERNEEIFNGDQGMSRILFKTKKNCQILKQQLKNDFDIQIKYLSPLSFFATGGLSKPLRTPKFIISGLIQTEKMIPQIVMKHIASRILVVLTKRENK